ncbi:hypothetical protein OF83DRAFT_1058862 [Amylostereum chailletii]|nr:hypothetical protein OF83DRAFT_1058862 [Amylostereum chailletii]
MLARSRTEPSLESAPGDKSYDSVISISSTSSRIPSQLNRGDTVLDIPSSEANNTQPTWLIDDDPAPPRSAPAPLTGTSQSNNVRTYAGPSRSFLVPLPSTGLPPGVTDDDLGLNQSESYKDLRRRWGVDDPEDDPRPMSPSLDPEHSNGESRKGKGKGRSSGQVFLAPGMMNDIKSITELRNKGESRRFMDDVGYLFEGMDADVGIGVRRTSALEIVTKLCDPDFARRAKATDFLTRSWDVLRRAGAGDGDRVLDSILVLFCALAAQSSNDLQELLRQEDFIPILCRLLISVSGGKDSFELISSGLSDAELKKAGISRPEKSSLVALNTVIATKSGLLSSKTCHLRQLVSYCLAALPPSALRPYNLPSVHGSLVPELLPLPSRISAFAAGLPLLSEDTEDTPDFQHIENCLSLFDSFLLGRWSEDEQKVQLCHDIINGEGQDDLSRSLLSLCIVTHTILRDKRYEVLSSVAGRCLETALRVLINLSHENPVWSKLLLDNALTAPLVMSIITTAQRQQRHGYLDEETGKMAYRADTPADEDPDGQGFDRLCLALGLLTNLVQADEEAKNVIHDICLDPNCSGEGRCARSCQCAVRIGALQCLVQVYLYYRKIESDSVDSGDPSAYIIRGHLAVLFGLLMRQNPRNEEAVITALPGLTRYAKLNDLAANAREFVGLYADFMMRVAREGIEQGDEDQDEGEREADISRVMRERAGEDVARDVVLFLELLRDQ